MVNHEQGPGGSPVDGASTDRRLSEDELFHVLQNRRRRETLRELRVMDTPAEIRDLADRVAARENGVPVEDLTSDQRQRVYIALYQTHLSTLDEVGVVEYDREEGSVERTGAADQFDRYLGDESRNTATGSPDDTGGSRWESLHSAKELSVMLVGGAVLGASVGSMSLWLTAGTVLLFAVMASGLIP